MSFNSRLSEERKRIGLNQKDFSATAGVTKTSQVNYESGERSPNVDYLQAIATTGVDIQYILTGNRTGEALISQSLAHSGVITQGLEADTAWEDFDLVPFYDVEASAGAGAFVDQELKISDMAFRKDWLRLRGLKAAHCALIKARGDSMEPTIHDGDLLLVDRSVETIKDDAIYIIQADHHLIVKRIQQSVDGALIVISDNVKYRDQTFDATQAEKIKVAGRVRWFGHEI